jgi:transposase-like protein
LTPNGENVMSRVSKKGRRIHSPAFKAAALERMKHCDSVVGLAQELRVNWRLLYRWREQAAKSAERAKHTAAEERIQQVQAEVTKLKLALAEQVQQTDFFAGALRKLEARRPITAGAEFTSKSGK